MNRTSSTLLDRLSVPLVMPWHKHAPDWFALPPETPASITERTPMLLLPAVALATLRYYAPAAECINPTERGMVNEATLRLAHWGHTDGKRSGWRIAENLQSVMWPNTRLDPSTRHRLLRSRVPRRGFDLIRHVDERSIGAVEFYVDMPSQSDPYRYTTMRLRDAIATLEGSASTSPNAVTSADQRQRQQIR